MKRKLKLYTLFSIAIIIASIIASIISIYIYDTRAAAGLGLVIGPAIVQLVFASKYIDLSAFIKYPLAIFISVIVHFSVTAMMYLGHFKIGLDRYGYFDFLIIYAVLSSVIWELITILLSKYKK